MIVSHDTYMLVCALLTGLVAAYWIVIDTVRLRAAMREDRADAVTRDKLFGSSLGIVVGIIGVVGVLKYYYF
ncbi:MAG TPA: hypothetical protein VM734_31195 [Kofleriaceae bacterium]|nr:hypothetical protein [Kofleriaceae bacterium]